MPIRRAYRGDSATERQPTTESEALLEEVIDTSLQTDRAHHDELGRTMDSPGPIEHPDESGTSPREQPAAPIDVGKIDE